MSVIEFPGIGNTDPLHGLGEIGAVGPHEEVVVVGHKYKRKNLDLEALGGFSNDIKEHCPILVIQENAPLLIAP